MSSSIACLRLTIDTATIPDAQGRIRPRPLPRATPKWRSSLHVVAFLSISAAFATASALWPRNAAPAEQETIVIHATLVDQ